MSFTYNFTAALNLSRVRLLVADTVDSGHIWEDVEINVALDMESSACLMTGGTPVSPAVYSPYRAAALLLDALAANKARLASVVKLLDVDLDAARAARELRATAKQYRETEESAGNFAIANMIQASGTRRLSLFGL